MLCKHELVHDALAHTRTHTLVRICTLFIFNFAGIDCNVTFHRNQLNLKRVGQVFSNILEQRCKELHELVHYSRPVNCISLYR